MKKSNEKNVKKAKKENYFDMYERRESPAEVTKKMKSSIYENNTPLKTKLIISRIKKPDVSKNDTCSGK